VFLFPLKFWSFVSFQREEKFLISNSRAHSHRERETHTERERERETHTHREREREREKHAETGRLVSSVSLRERLYFSTFQSRWKRKEREKEREAPSPRERQRERAVTCASSSNALI